MLAVLRGRFSCSLVVGEMESNNTTYFWGVPDVQYDWCEPYYGISPFVAEYWNAYSNLPFFFVFLFLSYRFFMNDNKMLPYVVMLMLATVAEMSAHIMARRLPEIAMTVFVIYPVSALLLVLYPTAKPLLDMPYLPSHSVLLRIIAAVNVAFTIVCVIYDNTYSDIVVLLSFIAIAVPTFASAVVLIRTSNQSGLVKNTPYMAAGVIIIGIVIYVCSFLYVYTVLLINVFRLLIDMSHVVTLACMGLFRCTPSGMCSCSASTQCGLWPCPTYWKPGQARLWDPNCAL